MMIDFQELDTPRPAGNKNKWIVLSSTDMFLILLKTGEMAYGPEHVPEDYQFDTELDAYFTSTYYYNQNNVGFPHGDAMLNAADSTPLIFDEDDEQKNMEFI